jgi:flagellar capping protein FliD
VSSGITNLAALGIDLNNDGTLSVNEAATYDPQGKVLHQSLANVLATNPGGVLNFFQNSNSTGFADNLNTALSNLADPVTGIVNADLAENQGEQTAITNEITNFQTQLAAQKIQLDQELSQVNANLEEYPFLLNEVTAELGSLTPGGSTTGATPSTNTTPTSGNGPNGSSGTGG